MYPQPMDRRLFLESLTAGFGLIGLATQLQAAGETPLAVRPPHFRPRAKRIIFLFMAGGPSHVDTFDPKPRLQQMHNQPLPFDKPKLERGRTGNLLASPWKFKQYGQTGMAISELLPHIAKHADDLCLIRSVVADNINHNGACLQMNTGEQAFSRPSLGSWLLYGLGTENQNLPGFVVLSPAQPAQGAPLWSNSFLPASYQGTLVNNLDRPIANLGNPVFTAKEQRQEIDLLQSLNQLHAQPRSIDSRLNARMESFELAFRMQQEAPETMRIDQESAATKNLYGIGETETDIFGRQCLMARRLIERGVRMVQVYHTQTSKRSSCQLWDQHGGLQKELPYNCLSTDKPIAGLLTDLKARGLLQDTIVVWGGEFGRSPTAENGDGREHHPFGFSMWLAGGGFQGGKVYGATDDFGWHAVQNRVHVHDLHATLLHALGLDHTKLTYRYAGRDYRLTDVHGQVVQALFA